MTVTERRGEASSSEVAALIARYERPLLQYALRFEPELESARDIVQETFLRLVKDGPRDDEAHARAWLYTVCRNLAFDQRRKERRVSQHDVDVPGTDPPSPTELMVRREESEGVRALLDELPANQREVVRLKFQAGLSYKEIAEVTALSVSNVGFLLHVALKTLRRRFAETSERQEVMR